MKCCRNGIIKFIRYNLFFTRSLAAKILTENYDALERFNNDDTAELNIENQEWNFLNRLKRLPDKSAFFYWYKALETLEV